MLPSGLQDSFYLFISLEIPPQIPFLSTWLQNSKWDRIGSGLLFCLENIHTNTSLKKGPRYDWQFSDFFPWTCLIAASGGCCSWEQRLAAVRASLQQPCETLELQQVTLWVGSPLLTAQAQGSLHGGCSLPLCPRQLTLLHFADLLLSAMCWVEHLLFHFWFPVWSWHEASL